MNTKAYEAGYQIVFDQTYYSVMILIVNTVTEEYEPLC